MRHQENKYRQQEEVEQAATAEVILGIDDINR
jgi:hypothetical protein